MSVRVELEQVQEQVGACRSHAYLLTVTDDGCGIPRDVTRRGLKHLEERAEQAGGHCQVDSSPRTGTTVTWQVPLS